MHYREVSFYSESIITVEPPNKGHYGDNDFVPCREVVPISEGPLSEALTTFGVELCRLGIIWTDGLKLGRRGRRRQSLAHECPARWGGEQ